MTSLAYRSIFVISAKVKLFTCWLVFALLCLDSAEACGCQQPASGDSTTQNILATINEQAITSDQVARDLQRTLGDRQLSPIEKKKAIELTTKKLVDQHITLDFLTKRGLAANSSEVDLQIENLKSELQTIDLSFAEYLDETFQTIEDLRFQTKWQISWKRYLKNKLSDEFLQSYFEKNKRRFDGTEIKTAHLLIKIPANGSLTQEQRINSQLLEIRKQILSRTLSWQEAVKDHSEAPTRLSGGSLGWISLQGPMPPSFTAAAFQLSKNEVSLPVKTKFGIHLIRCESVRDSALGWKDVRAKLEKQASRDLLRAIVKQHNTAGAK